MLSLWRSLLKSSHYLSFRMLWPTCVPIPTIWRLKYHLTASHFLRIIWPPSHSHTIEDWYVFHMCLIPPLPRKYQEITRVPTPAIWRTICVPQDITLVPTWGPPTFENYLTYVLSSLPLPPCKYHDVIWVPTWPPPIFWKWFSHYLKNNMCFSHSPTKV